MTVQKSFKRLVRSRMEKTGESYTAARVSLLAATETKATAGPVLTVSEEVILSRTGRGWEEWFDLLDEWGAAERPQEEASRWVSEVHGVDRWGSQAVSINYQRARGLRAIGERADGFMVSATKTVAVPVDTLFEAFVDASQRERWLPEDELRERTVLRPRSARYDWGSGETRVNVFFSAKGEEKSTATVQHERLPDASEAERMKAFWREHVTAMKMELER